MVLKLWLQQVNSKPPNSCFSDRLLIMPIFVFRLEKVKLKCIRSQSKVLGTAATVAGAMIMTLVKGPLLKLFWTRATTSNQQQTNGVDIHSSIKGALMITAGCFCWACFMILQVSSSSVYIYCYLGG